MNTWKQHLEQHLADWRRNTQLTVPWSDFLLLQMLIIYLCPWLIPWLHKKWSAHAGISLKVSFSVCNTKNSRKQVTLKLTDCKLPSPLQLNNAFQHKRGKPFITSIKDIEHTFVLPSLFPPTPYPWRRR